MRRLAPAVVALASLGCAESGPRLTHIAGLPFDADTATAHLPVRWEDHLILDPIVTGPGADQALLHTVGAPVGWDLDPETHHGTWYVTPGTDARLSIALVLESGRRVEVYSVVAEVDPPLDTDTTP